MALTYLWDFGDGSTSTDQNPTHLYDVAGTYDVSLSVYDDILEVTEILVKESYIIVLVPTIVDNGDGLISKKTNKSFRYGLNIEQGVGFSENTGRWPMPEFNIGAVNILDSDNYPHTVVIDYATGVFFNIGTLDGPNGSNIKKIYKDKVSVNNTDGFDISTEVKFKEDTGEFEKFLTEHLSGRYYLRPDKDSNKNQLGYDSKGFPEDIEFDSTITTDSSSVRDTATTKDINKLNEIVYDRKIEGHRLQTTFTSNMSGFQLVSRQNDYITKNIRSGFDNDISHETKQQMLLSEDLTYWLTRGKKRDLIGDTYDIILGDTSYLAPDGRSKGYIQMFGDVILSDYKSGGYFISFWSHEYTPLRIGGSIYPTLQYSEIKNGWTLNYTFINNELYTNMSVNLQYVGSSLFDIRVYNEDKTNQLRYYYDDITINHGDNVCPLF